MVSVECMHSCTSDAHEIRRVSLRLRKRERFFDVLSKLGIDGDETTNYASVDKEYRVVIE